VAVNYSSQVAADALAHEIEIAQGRVLPIIKIPIGSNFDQYRLEAGTHDLGLLELSRKCATLIS
jgi:hypothetical protein